MKITLSITASANALAQLLSIIDEEGLTVDADAPSAPRPITAAQAVMPEAVATAPEFDSSGLPWDARIHSKQKGTTGEGKWRRQRGIDDATYNAIEAELRARTGGNVDFANTALPVVAVNPAAEPVAPMPMPVAVQPVAPVAPVAPTEVNFHTVMTHVGTAMSTGTITTEYLIGIINEINGQLGLSLQSFTDMAAAPNAVQYCWAAFQRDGKA